MSTHVSTQYLTVAEVADRLAVSELTVRRRIADGTIPIVRLSTRAIRVPEHELETWLASVRHPSNNPPEAA